MWRTFNVVFIIIESLNYFHQTTRAKTTEKFCNMPGKLHFPCWTYVVFFIGWNQIIREHRQNTAPTMGICALVHPIHCKNKLECFELATTTNTERFEESTRVHRRECVGKWTANSRRQKKEREPIPVPRYCSRCSSAHHSVNILSDWPVRSRSVGWLGQRIESIEEFASPFKVRNNQF